MNGDIQYEDGSNKKKIFLIVGAVVLVAVIGGVTAWVLYSRSRMTEELPSANLPAGNSNVTNTNNVVTNTPGTGTNANTNTPLPVKQGTFSTEKTMTAQQKKEMGLPVDQDYKYRTYTPPPEEKQEPYILVSQAPPEPLDTDHDGLSDADEAKAGTDPNNPDTDGDGMQDGQEVKGWHTDPKTKNPLPTK